MVAKGDRKPIFPHALGREDSATIAPLLVAASEIADGRTATIRLDDGFEAAVPASVGRAFLDLLTLLATKERATLLVLDESEELTPGEAGRLLGVPTVEMFRLLKEGLLPFRDAGRHHRIRGEDVLALIQEGGQYEPKSRRWVRYVDRDGKSHETQ